MPDPVTSPHIAGNADFLTAQQRELIALAAELGRDRFAPRAARWDREAAFPFDNFNDLRDAGLLGICVPKAYGGMGGRLRHLRDGGGRARPPLRSDGAVVQHACQLDDVVGIHR